MLDFDLYSPTRFIFGDGREAEAGKWILAIGGKRVLLHYGGQSAIQSGLLGRVTQSLEQAGLEILKLGGVLPNPRDTLVYEGIELCRQHSIDTVLAVGGGSVLDSAKAIAIGACHDGDFWDFYGRGATPGKRLLLGTIVTLPATGSEGSNSSVIRRDRDQMKRGLRSDLNRPDFSIVNPTLTLTLPKWQVACGASDILSHIFERYFTKTRDVDLTDRLCEAAISSVIQTAPTSWANLEDYPARANLMWSSTLAHNGNLGVGRQEDWSVHALEAEVGGLYDTTHGAGLAAIYPAWMTHMHKRHPARSAQLARRVFGVSDEVSDEQAGLEGIRRLSAFYLSLELPQNLKSMGVKQEDLATMAAKVKRRPDGKCGFYGPLDNNDILEIYNMAWDYEN